MKLHLGVIDLPYTSGTGSVTTGQVAQWLENKYGVITIFYSSHQGEIVSDLENALGGALENLLMGAPVSDNVFAGGTSKIKNRFSVFLSTAEIENFGMEGIPTQAALDGVNNRLKLKKGPRRPSFIDTGLYSAAFLAWIEFDNADHS